jgi:hypothetical protein
LAWLRGLPEILVLIRYPRAAGNKDFEFFASFGTLSIRIWQLPLRRESVSEIAYPLVILVKVK